MIGWQLFSVLNLSLDPNLDFLVKLGIPSGVRPALLHIAFSFLLRIAVASGLGCCNCTDGSEGLTRRAVTVAVARAAADSKVIHVTARVR